MVKQRENSRWIKERRDKKGRLLCLIPTCNNLREPYKNSNRTKNYCKEHSFIDMRTFTSWSKLRDKVLERDNYTCVECGKQPRKISKYIDDNGRYIDTDCGVDESKLIGDHIKPIALGGDEWDIDNIQTLCIKCNKIKTKEDAKNIAKLRSVEKKLVNGQKQLKEVSANSSQQ